MTLAVGGSGSLLAFKLVTPNTYLPEALRAHPEVIIHHADGPMAMAMEVAMLVLSRHRDESIIIGDNIVITVVDVRGDKVRLGIDAPTDIPVHRQEVYEAIQRERQAGGTPQKNGR